MDNDILGILVQKGLVQNLSDYQPDEALRRDVLFQGLREKLRKSLGEWPSIDGQDYFIPFHPDVKLLYYNDKLLSKPRTWHELERLILAHPERIAIQAHPGKAAAVTVFEWVTAMNGAPLNFEHPKTQEALTRLWNIAPSLWPGSKDLQFDTANSALITDRVAAVDNWTYGMKVVMAEFGKTHIKVTALPGNVPVLGGDVLAIPTKAPDKKRAI